MITLIWFNLLFLSDVWILFPVDGYTQDCIISISEDAATVFEYTKCREIYFGLLWEWSLVCLLSTIRIWQIQPIYN